MNYVACCVEELRPGDVLRGPEALGVASGHVIRLPDPTVLGIAMVGREVRVRHTGFDDERTPRVLHAERGDIVQIRATPPSGEEPKT